MTFSTATAGIYDVQDCKEAATILASPQYSYIDAERVAIQGGSAGSYTTLSLTFAPDRTLSYYKCACAAYNCIPDIERLTVPALCSWSVRTVVFHQNTKGLPKGD